MSKQPNILYFVCHDLGKHAGCYGARVDTPNIDSFADESVKFTNCFTNSTACSPSRMCAMSGQYAHTSGGVGLAHMGWPLPEDVNTIVDYLNDAGYETIHAGMEHERHPGQNRYQVDMQKHWVHFDTERGVDDALEYLEKRDRSKPFYLNIGSQQPHGSTWGKTDDMYGGPVPPEDVWVPHYLHDTPALRREFGRFQAAIRYMDKHFGRLMDGLKRLGHDEDTIVVFTTDHGIAAPRSKGTLYDRGIEIALIVRMPGGEKAGSVCDHLVQNIDFTPTLLEATGTALPDVLQGRSFWPCLKGDDYQPHEQIFIERNFHGQNRIHGQKGYIDRYDPMRCIRTPEFHYIQRFDPEIKGRPWLPFELVDDPTRAKADWEDGAPYPEKRRPEFELYDLRHDPQEFINVQGRPEYREIEKDLHARLQQWMEETDDHVLRTEVPQRREAPGWGPWEGIPDTEEEARAQGWFDK
ncbi:MAG: sulfatase [Candidatus Sumerlaeota bacterium]